MTKQCFATHRNWNQDIGWREDKRISCCALNREAYYAMKAAGKCGTYKCPFYKPKGKENLLRDKEGMVQ